MKKQVRKSASSATAERVFDAVLEQVPFEGWTEAAYAEGLRQAKVSRQEADKLFPQGVRDLVAMFGQRADAAMQKRIQAERGFERMRVRDKVAFAVRARLEALAPQREAMRRLTIWYAMPHHIPLGLRRVYKTVDLIWVAAGDTSTDYNYYTKRMLLSGVLKATVLFWLGDDSPGQTATWAFLERRIGDVMKFGKSVELLKEFKPGEIVAMVRDKVRRAV